MRIRLFVFMGRSLDPFETVCDEERDHCGAQERLSVDVVRACNGYTPRRAMQTVVIRDGARSGARVFPFSA